MVNPNKPYLMHKDKIAQSSLQGFSSVRKVTSGSCTETVPSRAGGGKAIMKGAEDETAE